MPFSSRDHAFVVCAYKDNAHLEECILSLKNQTVPSTVYLSTATPSPYIEDICRRNQVPMFVNTGEKGPAADWNFAFSQADTPLVTLAHQDDIYEPDFLETVLSYANRREDALILFTDYYELKLGGVQKTNTLLKIKRILNWPLRFRCFYRSQFVRRRSLSFGCAICCPSVTLVRKNVGFPVFDQTYRNSCDYYTWVLLSKKLGSFIYIPKMLMAHRIYAESATTLNLQENIRKKEELEILCTLWPRPIAKCINHFYAKSEKSNQV